MVLKIIVLFLSFGILVSSNNGYPIIPAQTYPIYQQNGYTNPSGNQPSDFTPYSQGVIIQNQSPPLDLSPSSIGKILLNRILSSHSVQSNFDPNSRGYGSNFVEQYNNAIAPNSVNSYFAVPTANNQSTKVNKENTTADNKTERKHKKTKKRKSKSSRKHIESEKNHSHSSKVESNIQDSDKESNKKSRKRPRKHKSDVSLHDNNTKQNVNENNKTTKKKKSNKDESKVKTPDDEDTKAENAKPRRRHKKKPKSDKGNTKTVVEETTNKPKQIQEGLNVAHFNEGIIQENRIPRNPIPDATDLFKSMPNLPENIANSFKGLPQFNNPAMNNLFANFENIYQSLLSNNKGTNENVDIKKRKPIKSKNNNTRKTEGKVKNSNTTQATVTTTLKPIVTPKINIVTPEKTIYIKDKTHKNVDPISKNETLNISETPNEVIKNTHEFENDEIKDMESNINDPVNKYEGYIDDYYPQFTDSAAYTANNREIYIKNLGDTKYYYAVDKKNPIINKMRFESFSLPERIIKDYDVNKNYDDTENEAIDNAKLDSKNTIEDKIQFRSPPHLETPDFETRKVEKSEINPDLYYRSDENDYDPRFLGDKASFYSESKVPYYPGTKENNKKIKKDKPKEVETVFARSKVVNYGPVYKPEDDSVSTATSNQEVTDDTDYRDEGTTYVLATSLDHPAKYW